MSVINASKFKEQCLWLLDHLTPEGITITKRGKAVAKLIPIEGSCAGLIGSLKGRLRPKGGLLSTGVKWHAES